MAHQQSNNTPGTDTISTTTRRVNDLLNLGDKLSSNGKAKVIGLYGISGSGKTFLLNQLKQKLNEEHFSFYEGSDVIADLVPGGLGTFQKLEEQWKQHWRKVAIDTIAHGCTASGKAAVVTGHLMFWPENEQEGQMVYTSNDLAMFTHILYLDVPADIIERHRGDDTQRVRPFSSTLHLLKWQTTEKNHLRELCRRHNILFSLLAPNPTMLDRASKLLHDFRLHDEAYNTSRAEKRLDDVLSNHQGQLETMLVMDADKTLAPEDTGALFWQRVAETRESTEQSLPLKALFSSPLGYSYNAFRQAVLLYEEAVDEEEYDRTCEVIASKVNMYPEFVSLLKRVGNEQHVGGVIVSCGLLRVWQKVLEREGLSDTIKVIAGGRIADGLVVTATVKAFIVSRLQSLYHLSVWAFGDSPLDLDMLKEADQGIVVVGDERARSRSMEDALSVAIDRHGFQARQVLLPSNVSPRLDVSRLPLADLTETEFVSSIFSHRCQSPTFPIFLAAENGAARLLATPMRDSAVNGPALRKAHRRAGAYLAAEFLTSVIGVEECQISHVLGHNTTGYRLLREPHTTIIALMRAGEPMASGVNEVFPLAMFVHASRSEDIKAHHLKGQAQVLLVDSVVNSGKTIREFVATIRSLHPNIRIVVVAGVVQARCISPNTAFYRALADHGNLSLVALRCSETKFTGHGGTDTGNRLFNTTHLP